MNEDIRKNELVSVVIPIYKVENYVCNTLESIVNQTYRHIEIVLVDDGTPDQSAVIAENYLKNKDVKWKIIHQKNSGLSAARNTGIAHASGDWIICPDSDDYIAPETIERLLGAAKRGNSLCSFCGYKSVQEEHAKDEVQHDNGEKLYDSKEMKELFLDRRVILLVPGMLAHKSLFANLLFDTSCPYDEDIHFLWRLLFNCQKIAYVDADFYNYLSRGTSMVHTLKPEAYLATSKAYEKMVAELLKKHPDEEKIISCIYPKYRLGGLHVLAKSTQYRDFVNTVKRDGYRKNMSILIQNGDLRLRISTILYIISLRGFYEICKRR